MGFYFSNDNNYDEYFITSHGKNGTPAPLLKGIVAAESQFNPKSVLWEPSRKSTRQPGDTDASRGLMQTTQKAVLSLGWPAEDTNFDKLFDPATSIEWGARELAKLLNNPYWKLTGGKPGPQTVLVDRPIEEMAVAAYNMGYPRSIKSTTPFIADIFKYPVTYKDAPPEGWYFANQPYVNLVMAFTAMYNALSIGDMNTAERLRDEIKKKAAGGQHGPWESWFQPVSALGLLPLLQVLCYSITGGDIKKCPMKQASRGKCADAMRKNSRRRSKGST